MARMLTYTHNAHRRSNLRNGGVALSIETPSTVQRGSLALIRSHLPNMRPSFKRIADFILENPERTLNLSIIQVADIASVSPGTVTRFCANLGYSGFPQFKSALRVDLLSIDERFHEDIKMDDPIEDIVQKVFDLGIQGLRDTLVTLDPKAVYRAAEAILRARHVCCAPTGIASSGIVNVLTQKLLNLGIFLMNYSNMEMASRCIDTLSNKDVVIAISHSGSAKNQINFMRQCREQGATTICITNYIEAPLVNVSDVPLITAAGREAPLRGEPIAVRLSQLALIDTLYTALSVLRYRDENISTLVDKPRE